MAAPACAQIAMAAAMVVEGRWMFAAMTIPGLVGCIASIMLMRARSEPPRAASASSRPSADEADAAPSRIDSPDWATAMGFGDDALTVWREVTRRWLAARDGAAGRMPRRQPATIGRGADGEDVTIDLASHGPHALVAGTTGSGKSVLLRQWCLALAVSHPPSQLTMAFLDFKGGAAFRELERLPHTVGCVSDLDLAHAVRALRAIERELKRRERLTAEAMVGQIDDMADPPPRLLVVVDEFNALREQLPDTVDRLTRLASLGRSLGMNLIACTQHPMGQVNATMKANIALNVCLRVRDGLQSSEMLGSPAAARIPPDMPGFGFVADGERTVPFRCVSVTQTDGIVAGIAAASRTMDDEAAAPPLFSAPLPRAVPSADAVGMRDGASPTVHEPDAVTLRLGLRDDGVMVMPCDLTLGRGESLAVIAGRGRGKTTALRDFARQLARMGIPYGESLVSPQSVDGAMPGILLLDDADALLDPFAGGMAGTMPGTPGDAGGPPDSLASMLRQRRISVVAAFSRPPRAADQDLFDARIVMPVGDRTADLMAGIPAALLARMGDDERRLPGRGVLMHRDGCELVQLHAPPGDAAAGAARPAPMA